MSGNVDISVEASSTYSPKLFIMISTSCIKIPSPVFNSNRRQDVKPAALKYMMVKKISFAKLAREDNYEQSSPTQR